MMMMMEKFSPFEKNVLAIIFIEIAAFAPLSHYLWGSACSAGFLLGASFAAISFFTIVYTVHALLPSKVEKPTEKRGKLFVTFLYVIKITVFVLSFWIITQRGAEAILAFVAGFSILMPALFIAGLARQSPPKPDNFTS